MKLMKVNFDSQYKVKSKQLKLTNCEFVCPTLTGTCFDNCNLEGSKFNARTTCVTSINWFGKHFIYKQ